MRFRLGYVIAVVAFAAGGAHSWAEGLNEAEDSSGSGPKDVMRSAASRLAPARLKWTAVRSSQMSRDALLRRIRWPSFDTQFFQPRTTELWLDNGAFYARTSELQVRVNPDTGAIMNNGEPAVSERENAVVGSVVYLGSGDPTSRSPILIVETAPRLAGTQGKDTIIDADFLYEAGYRVPRTAHEFAEAPGLESLVDFLLHEGGELVRQETIREGDEERTLIEIASHGRQYIFTLDARMAYAVISREEYTPERKLLVSASNSDFKQFRPDGPWLPMRSTVRHRAWLTAPDDVSDEDLLTVNYTLIEMEAKEISPELFDLRRKYTQPGTIISDATIPGADRRPQGRVEYPVPSDPANLEKVIQHALEGREFIAPKGTANRRILIIANCAIAAVIALSLGWRYFRKNAGGSS